MVLLALELSENVFWDKVRTCVASSSEHDILVLVHGYNVTFDQGLRRAAQIVKDLNFCGAPVLYSWPSRGSVTGYSADEASVEWSAPHLRAFLRQLLETAGAALVHVIAHSMGNRAAVAAIRELQVETLARGAAQLSQFVLAAPDIDADTFRQFAAEFAHRPKRCTLSANTDDLALAASDWKHGGYPRAGGGGDDLVVVPDVETVDATGLATDFLSHSYFAGSSPVISDLFYVIRAIEPDRRARLQRRKIGDLVYWRIAQ
jgi:esterase/lipase superfamily enzyme